MVKYFFIQIFIALIIYIAWITVGNFSGGEVGMTPLTVLIVGSIQFFCGSVLYLLLKRMIKINPLVAFLLYLLLYELVFFFFTGNFSLENIFADDIKGSIYRGYSLSSLIAGFLTMTLFYIFRKGDSRKIA